MNLGVRINGQVTSRETLSLAAFNNVQLKNYEAQLQTAIFFTEWNGGFNVSLHIDLCAVYCELKKRRLC